MPAALSICGLSQGRRIVDSIARHRDRAAFFLQPLHDSRFLLGKNFSFELVDSQLPSNVFGSCVAVAREHHQSQPFAFQIANRLWRGWLNRVSDTKQSGNSPVYRDEDYCLALSSKLLCTGGTRLVAYAEFLEPVFIPNCNLFVVNFPANDSHCD